MMIQLSIRWFTTLILVWTSLIAVSVPMGIGLVYLIRWWLNAFI